MAKFRQVHVEFWQDGFVLDLTPEEKYFYIYLMTNSKTSQCGIYELPKRIIETDTGYSRETVDKLLQRFIDYGKILYDESTKELMLINWVKYNSIKSPKTKSCIEKELRGVKNKDYLYTFNTLCKEYRYSINTPFIDLGEEKEQEQEEEQEEEQEKEQEKEQQQERRYLSADDFYQQNIGILNPFIGECIANWVNDLCEELVIEALKRALAQQKKWKYAEGILRNWSNQNVRNLSDVQALDKEFERRGGKPNRSLFEQGDESKKRQEAIKPLSPEEEERLKRMEEDLPY